MATQRIPLSHVFGSVLESMQENQAYLNDLDRDDHDAGDNSVHNWRVVEEALRRAERRDQDASAALMSAADALRRRGQGQTAQMYASGLSNAAAQLQGQAGISAADFLPLLQGLVGGMHSRSSRAPGQGTPMDALLPGIMGYMAAKQRGASDQQALMAALAQAAGTSGMLGGLLGGGAAPRQAVPAPQPRGGLGDLLGGLLGGGATAAPSGGGGLGDLLGGLLGGGQAPYQPPAPSTPEMDDVLGELLGGRPNPFGPQYTPPPQPDPGAAGGAALLEGLLRGLGGAPGGHEAPASRLGRRGPTTEA